MNELDLFTAALSIQDSQARAAYLDEHCQGNQPLRQRLEELLKAYRQADEVLPVVPALDPQLTEMFTGQKQEQLIGTMIADKYKLLEEIGEGGMGTVFVAEQTEPVKRKVAVKLIKAGMDSKSVLARFEAERQALAMMDHPNIAKVLDAGLTEERRPYFVMEYIKGLPLTKYCDDVKLSIDERLKLFIQICQAVQHAHQKGIIHRDLKPTNILIALYDGKPVPKVIDFGLAKALHHSLTERTLHTGHEMVLGTPLYMSPEQAELNNLDIDTRSDIYSLGVILYELLTGVTPLEKQRFKDAAWAEVLRIIKEEEPSKPSTKLSHSESLPSVAAQRQMEPKKLSTLMKGDLDWIVMKALEKDRNRRYETANGFAADVLRYLSGEAVTAVPPSAGYRFKKFVKRNKGKVTAAGLVFLTLVAGIAGTSWGLYREAQRAEGERLAKQVAEKAADAERAANEQTQKRLKQIEKSNAVLTSVFEDLDIYKVKESKEPLEAVLAKRLVKAGELLEGDSVGDPLVVANLQYRLGESLLSLGHPLDAIPLFIKARDTYSAKLGAKHPDTFTSLSNLALGYLAAGKMELARPLLEETLKLSKAIRGASHPDTISAMSNLAICYQATGKLDLALPLYEETLKLSKVIRGANHPDTFTSMNNLAAGYLAAGKTELALPLMEETLKLSKTIRGIDHPNTLNDMSNLAMCYQTAGKLDLALPLYQETVKLSKAKLGIDHPDTLGSMNNLAGWYQKAGKLDLALPLYQETVKLSKAKLGIDHPHTLTSMKNLAAVYQGTGKLDLALPLFQEAAEGIEKQRFQHEHAAVIIRDTISAYEVAGQFDQAESWRRKWLAVVKERAGAESIAYSGELAALGLNLLKQKNSTNAEVVLGECLVLREKKQPDTWTTFNTQSQLGGALLGQKRYDEAEPLLLKGYAGMKAREMTILPQGKPRLPEALDRLIQLYTETNKPDEVKKWQAEKDKFSKTPE